MTTTELTVADLTTYELAVMAGAAHTNMLAAWRVQSTCTVDDGYTLEQANAAIDQANDAQAIFYMLNDQLEARLAMPDYYQTVNGLMGGDYESEIIY